MTPSNNYYSVWVSAYRKAPTALDLPPQDCTTMINLNKTYTSFNQNDLDRLIFALHMIGNMSAANIQCLIAQYYGFSFEQAPSTRYIEKVINNPITLQKGQKALENLDQLVSPNSRVGIPFCTRYKLSEKK